MSFLKNNPLITGLTLLYLLLGMFTAFQFGRIKYYNHNPWSFQVAFLGLVAVWSLCRILFFTDELVHSDDKSFFPVWVGDSLYWAPTNIEFAMFGLFVLFQTSILYRQQHNHNWTGSYKNIRVRTYLLANAILVILGAVWIVLSRGPTLSDQMITARLALSGAIYLLLDAMLILYAYRLHAVVMSEGQASVQVTAGTKRITHIVYISYLLVAVFASRFTYNILTVLDPSFRVTIKSAASSDAVAFVCFAAWEVVPAAAVLLFFGWIPATKRTVHQLLRTDATENKGNVQRDGLDQFAHPIRQKKHFDGDVPTRQSPAFYGASAPYFGISPTTAIASPGSAPGSARSAAETPDWAKASKSSGRAVRVVGHAS